MIGWRPATDGYTDSGAGAGTTHAAAHVTARTRCSRVRVGMTSTLSAGFAASGVADGPDAVHDAVRQALDGLSGSASFALVFPPATIGPDDGGRAGERRGVRRAVGGDVERRRHRFERGGAPPAAPPWRSATTSMSPSGSVKAPHTIRAARPGEPPRRPTPASTRERANPCCSCSTTRMRASTPSSSQGHTTSSAHAFGSPGAAPTRR